MEKAVNTSSKEPLNNPIPEFVPDAEIHDWALIPHFQGGLAAHGQIFGDKKGRFPDGAFVRTSVMVSLRNGQLITANSKYLLVNK
jgi:hypothetical protein